MRRSLPLLLALLLAPACFRYGSAPGPCYDQTCSGKGLCGLAPDGDPRCACDPGYMTGDDPLTCVRDPHFVRPPEDAAAPDALPDAATPDLPPEDGPEDAATDDAAPEDAAPEDAPVDSAAGDP